MISTIQIKFEKLPPNIKGAALLMVAALFFTLMIVAIKYLGTKFHVTQILLVRQIIMTIILLPAIFNHFPGALKANRPGLQFVRILFALTAMLAGFTAVIHMQLADATAIGFAKSFFVTIFAVLILKETVGIRRWSAVAVGFIGVMIMLRPGTETVSIYAIYALVGSACAGFVMVLIRLMSRTDSTQTILSWQAIGVGLAVAGPGIWYWQMPTLFEWGIMVAMGITSFIGQWFNIQAYKLGEASVLASLDYVRLLYSVLFGYFIFANLPSTATWIGAIIIVGASIYTIMRESKLKKTLTRSPHGRGFTS